MRKRGLIAGTNPKAEAAETYRRLRTGIEMASREGETKTIAIASAEPGEGKSTASANLAIAYAQANRSVLLLDSDMRSPVLHRIFELENDKGLSSALTGRCEMEEVIRQSEFDGLQVVCAGPIPPSPTELLDSAAMEELLAEAKRRYDIVILDTPALAAGADALIVADKCDGAVLVIRRGRTKFDAAAKAKETLDSGRGKVLGAVFNRPGR
jgi:capsular exopolysaccharide synthesis family protein